MPADQQLSRFLGTPVRHSACCTSLTMFYFIEQSGAGRCFAWAGMMWEGGAV